MAQADFLLAERPHAETARLHALLHEVDERGVLGIDLPVDPPVEIARGAHLPPVVAQHIADLEEPACRRADGQQLNEVALIGLDLEGDIWPQLELEPVHMALATMSA